MDTGSITFDDLLPLLRESMKKNCNVVIKLKKLDGITMRAWKHGRGEDLWNFSFRRDDKECISKFLLRELFSCAFSSGLDETNWIENTPMYIILGVVTMANVMIAIMETYDGEITQH